MFNSFQGPMSLAILSCIINRPTVQMSNLPAHRSQSPNNQSMNQSRSNFLPQQHRQSLNNQSMNNQSRSNLSAHRSQSPNNQSMNQSRSNFLPQQHRQSLNNQSRSNLPAHRSQSLNNKPRSNLLAHRSPCLFLFQQVTTNLPARQLECRCWTSAHTLMWLEQPMDAEKQTVHVFLQVHQTKKCWRKNTTRRQSLRRVRKGNWS